LGLSKGLGLAVLPPYAYIFTVSENRKVSLRIAFSPAAFQKFEFQSSQQSLLSSPLPELRAVLY